ncbi:MAG TPA: right-handed parallel beta-helix repeat-containing protein, partial [Myxococcales bacterium]
HVDLQGARILTDFDIVAEAGPSTALVKSFDVSVTGGAVTLTLTSKVVEAEIAAVEILPAGEPHLATTAAASCGPSDGVCPASCTYAKDADCPPADCAYGPVSSACTCGSTVVTTGYCCSGTPQGTSCSALVPAFYVSPTGDDANAGTFAAPFGTLEKARDAARASATVKTVYLLGGVYARTATLELGGADAGESWLAYPGQTPILEGGSATQNAIVVNGDDITIRWLTFQNFVTNTIFVGWGDARRVVIDSNTIRNTISDAWVQAAIYLCCGQHTDAKITHNLVDGANYIGIHAGASASSNGSITGVTISHNQVSNTCRTVADCGAIYVWDIQHLATNITIDNNVVQDFASATSRERGIYLDDETSNVTARNNIIYGYGQWSFQIHGGDHNVFTNNIFDVSKAVRLGLYQDDGGANPNYGMAANTVSCNIVYSNAAPPDTLWDKYGSLPVALPTVSENLYWGAAGALPNTAPIVDSSPHVADPGFVNPAAADYRFSGANPGAFCGFQPIDVSQVGPLPNL